MIEHLDNLLRELLINEVGGITDPVQVRFEPPDDDWRTWVANLTVDGNPADALNVYLADARENRKLRSNERVRHIENGLVNEEAAPARVDYHYLITAWSPATPTAAVEPALDEHRLLQNVVAALFENAPLNPSRVYPPGAGALGPWGDFAESDLPTQILPVEGFPKLSEFWGTMGQNHRWKPAIYLIVTLPVVFAPVFAGPMVTTRITTYLQTGRPDSEEVWIQIGGHVREQSGGSLVPVPEAWVRLEEVGTRAPLQVTETDEVGRFTFSNLQRGRYELHYRAEGRQPQHQIIDVPSATGGYDVQF